jgi:sterol desaturase/sphingolipid hydroxylase (fatty acid hydroxylase superfamily)
MSESPIGTWAAMAAVGLAIELIINRKPSSAWLNIRYAIVYALAIFLISPSLGTAINALLQKTGAGFIRLDFFSEGLVPQIGAGIVLLIVTDFFYYWLHRSQHTFEWLWHQHAVHHSDEAVNVSTSARHHWLEFVFQALAVSVPMSILFKLSPVSMWAVSSFVGAYGWFNHMNVRLGFGPVSWLACSPQLHRIHHSSLPHHHDRNFAAYFPVWDVLFGTYYHPANNEYPPTGVEGLQIKTVAEANLYPFKRWIRQR